MTKYRIVKNKYGYYKIQRLATFKLFGKIIYQKWKDSCFDSISLSLQKFKHYDHAIHAMNNLIEQEEKENNEWEIIINSSKKEI